MRKFAKLLSMLLVVATLMGLCAFSASAAEFKDISAKDEALYEAVQLLNSLGIAKGQSETTYGANKPVTREQMSAFIYRMMKQGRSLEGGANTTPFTDLKDDTFFGMIAWAHATGVIKGVSATEFNPTGKITLQDSYVMLSRALGYEKDGALNYPHDYIDIAETIGLNEDLDEDVQYTDFLNRGQVAIILHNAFYADMNETYKESFIPAFDKPGIKQKGAILIEKPESVFHKIYGMQIIERRVVATPNFALDMSGLPNPSSNPHYLAYAPTGGDTMDEDYIITAPVIAGESYNKLENEKSMIAFKDLEALGFTGKADDYFLKDLTLFVKQDGTLMAASYKGEYVEETSASVPTNEKVNKQRDYYYSSSGGSEATETTDEKIKADSKGIYSGYIKMGSDYAYFWNIPEDVDNAAWSLYPSVDKEGRMTYQAGYTWSGAKQPSLPEPAYTFNEDRFKYMDQQRANHNSFSQIFSNITAGNKYNVEYYDCNNDGAVDYFWLQPYTWGKIVDKTGAVNTTQYKHTKENNDAANRAYFNSATSLPEIYVGDAVVEGGAYEDGQFVFAYVSGPANYVRIASDDINKTIKHSASISPVRLSPTTDYNFQNTSTWDDGTTINAWNSGNTIVGHVAWSSGLTAPKAICGLSSDNSASEHFASAWRGDLKIGQKWEIYHASGRILWGKKLSDVQNLAEQYAIVDYINYENKVVVFNAGGIDFDASLEYEPHVWAYIGGKRVIVPIAKKVDGVNQDSEYFIDNKIVNELSTYTVDKNGKYTFKPYDFSKAEADAADLAGIDDTATYTVTASLVSLAKFNNNIYEFVPGDGYTQLPATLKPNNMRFVSVDADTLIIVKFVNEDGEDDFMVYSGESMPNFDAEDAGMSFTEAYVVIENNPDSTITERLSFLYCVIGGEIVDASKSDEKYALIMGHKSVSTEDDKSLTVYETIDPATGVSLGEKSTSKETSAIIPDHTIYELTDLGDIKYSDSGKLASLAHGSRDLTTVESFEADSNLLFLANDVCVVVDENTVYTHLDRFNNELTVIDSEVLSMDELDDEDDVYFNTDESKLTVFVMTEEIDNEELELATLIIVVNG